MWGLLNKKKKKKKCLIEKKRIILCFTYLKSSITFLEIQERIYYLDYCRSRSAGFIIIGFKIYMIWRVLFLNSRDDCYTYKFGRNKRK